MIRLLPLLAIMALLLGLVSLAHAQEATTDTSSDPDQADDPPVALQQNSPVKLADNTDEVDDEDDGLVVGFVAGDPGATPPSAASYRSYAVSFTTGSDAGWYQLVEVLIATKVTGTPLARLSIHRDHQGSPHAEALYVTHFRGASKEDPDLYLEFPDNTPLNPNQTYWAVFEEVSGLGVYEISTAPNGDEGPDSWPISDTSLQREFFSLAGRTWQASALNPIAMVVDGYPVEERVLVGAHGLRDTAADGPFLRFGTERVTKGWLKLPKGRTYDGGATNPNIRIDCEPQFVEGPDTETSWRLCSTNRHYDHEWAGGRGFTTGPNPTGYTISGLGVDIDAQSGTLDPVANLYAAEAFSSREGARDPQSPLASYQATAGIGGSPDRFAPRTAGSERSPCRAGADLRGLLPKRRQRLLRDAQRQPRRGPGRRSRLDPRRTLRQPLRPSARLRRRQLEPRQRGRQADPAQRLRLAEPAAARPEPGSPAARPRVGQHPGSAVDLNRPTCRQENQPGNCVCGFIHQRQRCGSYPSWCTN